MNDLSSILQKRIVLVTFLCWKARESWCQKKRGWPHSLWIMSLCWCDSRAEPESHGLMTLNLTGAILVARGSLPPPHHLTDIGPGHTVQPVTLISNHSQHRHILGIPKCVMIIKWVVMVCCGIMCIVSRSVEWQWSSAVAMSWGAHCQWVAEQWWPAVAMAMSVAAPGPVSWPLVWHTTQLQCGHNNTWQLQSIQSVFQILSALIHFKQCFKQTSSTVFSCRVKVS